MLPVNNQNQPDDEYMERKGGMMSKEKKYFEKWDNIANLKIVTKDNYQCVLQDEADLKYDGFCLYESEKGNSYIVCDLSFQKSSTDDKYQARLKFRRTDAHFKTRNVNKGSDEIIISFFKGKGGGYRCFWKMIYFLYQWRKTVDVGKFEDYYSITDSDLGDFLSKINEDENKKTIIEALKKTDSKKLADLSNLVSIQRFKSLLKKWDKNKTKSEEGFWQDLFKENAWILSQVFSCPYIKIGEKTYCGGKNDENRGGVEGDFLYQNKLTGNLAFIEIKTPNAKLVGSNLYRGQADNQENSIYPIKESLTGAVNQVINQKKVYTKTHGENKGKTLNNVKCVLIVGTLPSKDDEKKSFELYRSSLVGNIEIVTFDELKDRIENLIKILKSTTP